MSRIVVLAGSVRKGGNTDMLVNEFVRGAGQNDNEIDIISVADHKVNPCTGCDYCFKSEGGRCVQKDDMEGIYEKLKEADIIIIASPIYFYGISAQLKAVVDRLHTPMRDDFKAKALGLILVGGAVLDDLFDPVIMQYDMIRRFFGLEDIGQVLVRGVRAKGAVAGNKALEEAFRLGASIY